MRTHSWTALLALMMVLSVTALPVTREKPHTSDKGSSLDDANPSSEDLTNQTSPNTEIQSFSLGPIHPRIGGVIMDKSNLNPINFSDFPQESNNRSNPPPALDVLESEQTVPLRRRENAAHNTNGRGKPVDGSSTSSNDLLSQWPAYDPKKDHSSKADVQPTPDLPDPSVFPSEGSADDLVRDNSSNVNSNGRTTRKPPIGTDGIVKQDNVALQYDPSKMDQSQMLLMQDMFDTNNQGVSKHDATAESGHPQHTITIVHQEGDSSMLSDSVLQALGAGNGADVVPQPEQAPLQQVAPPPPGFQSILVSFDVTPENPSFQQTLDNIIQQCKGIVPKQTFADSYASVYLPVQESSCVLAREHVLGLTKVPK